MIFMSKKRFEREIERRISKIQEINRIEEKIWKQEQEIGKLKSKIKAVRDQILIMGEELDAKEKGKISGYYINPEGSVSLTDGTHIVNYKKGTEPEG